MVHLQKEAHQLILNLLPDDSGNLLFSDMNKTKSLNNGRTIYKYKIMKFEEFYF